MMNRYSVEVICPVCKRHRLASRYWVERSGTRCRDCSNKAKTGVMLKDGVYTDHAGYRYIYVSSEDEYFAMSRVGRAETGGYIQEHRLVMAKHLGRLLKDQEVVHHLNGDRQDNRLSNLELFPSHSAHMKAEHKPSWLRESHEAC